MLLYNRFDFIFAVSHQINSGTATARFIAPATPALPVLSGSEKSIEIRFNF